MRKYTILLVRQNLTKRKFSDLFICLEKVFEIPCGWNYRLDHCWLGNNCRDIETNGVSLLHGNRGTFHGQGPFGSVYETFRNVSINNCIVRKKWNDWIDDLLGTKGIFWRHTIEVCVQEITSCDRIIWTGCDIFKENMVYNSFLSRSHKQYKIVNCWWICVILSNWLGCMDLTVEPLVFLSGFPRWCGKLYNADSSATFVYYLSYLYCETMVLNQYNLPWTFFTYANDLKIMWTR